MPRQTVMLAVIFLTAFTASCTTELKQKKLESQEELKEPVFSYYLPRQKYRIEVSYELVQCPSISQDKRTPIRIIQRANVVETSVPDLDEHYALRFQSMNNFLKTSTFTASVYGNQTLHKVGASVDDRTAGVVKNLTTAAVDIAKMVIGFGLAEDSEEICNSDTLAALTAIKTAQEKLKDPMVVDKERAAAAAVVQIARSELTQKLVRHIDPPTAKGKDGPTLLIEDIHLSKEKSWSWFTCGEYDTLAQCFVNKNIDEYKSDPSDPDALLLDYDENNKNNLISTLKRVDKKGEEHHEPHEQYNPDDELKRMTSTQIIIKPNGDYAIGRKEKKWSFKNGFEEKSPQGVYYRKPQYARILVCPCRCTTRNEGDSLCKNESASEINPDAKKIAESTTMIAQWGRPMYLELTNRLFDKNNISLTFAPNGILKSMEFGSESALERATGALADTTTQVRGLQEAQLKAEKEAADAAKLAADEEASAELEASKAQAALLQSKIEIIERERRLLELGGELP